MATVQCHPEPHITVDDIVRIDDLFHGRITEIHPDVETMNIVCRGHTQEMNHRYLPISYVQTGATSGDILQYLIETYLDRICAGEIMQGKQIQDFRLSAHQTNIFDALKTIEIYDAEHRLVERPIYDNGLLTAFSLEWKVLPTVPRMELMYRAPHIHDVVFQVISHEIHNQVKIFGNVTEDSNGASSQYHGQAVDENSQSQYGVREYTYCSHTYNSNSMCQYIAQGIIDRDTRPKLNGTISMQGVDIIPGDLVFCDFPVFIEGKQIQGNYRVMRVTHQMNPWVTEIDVGQSVRSANELLIAAMNDHRLSNLDAIL